MKFEDAIKGSIKAFIKGKGFDGMSKVNEKIFYSAEYFDELEEALVGPDKDKKKKKKSKKEKTDA